MLIRKMTFLIFIITFFVTAGQNFIIKPISDNEYQVIIKTGKYSIEKQSDEYGEFDIIATNNEFELFKQKGLPILPCKTFSLSGKFVVNVIAAQYDTLENVNLRPGSAPVMIAPDFYAEPEKPQYSKECGDNKLWPSKGIISKEQGNFRGNMITAFTVTPFAYNFDSKQLHCANQILIKLKKIECPLRSEFSVNPLLANILSNSDVNRVQASDIEENGRAGKIVIFTIDSLLPAVEKLVRWQRQKGFDVVVESKATMYPKAEVISAIDRELVNSDAASKYILLFGNSKMVEEYEVKWPYFNSIGNSQHVSNFMYGNPLGDDHLPDFGRGQVAANNLKEAMICVDKFIKYETDPVDDPSFYNNILGAAQAGFSHEVVEMIMDYLGEKGYTTTPRYYSNSVKEEMVERMNEGVLIAAQYDHGYRGGWATPEFTGNEINTMTNGDMLPYMFSINCLSGTFDYAGFENKWNPKKTYHPTYQGLTERFLYKENGGGVGALGATNITYTGYNDTLIAYLFKAIWPEDDSKIPLYRTADFFDYALYKMHEKYGGDHKVDPYTPDNMSFCEYHFRIYHNMCDPTLQIRTKVPTAISAIYDPNFAEGDAVFNISSINLDDGTAVLYNMSKDIVIGRAKIMGGAASIPLESDKFNNEDTVTLVINGVNCIPLMESFVSGQPVNIEKKHKYNVTDIKIIDNGFYVTNNKPYSIEVQIWNIQGKKVFSKEIRSQNRVRFNNSMINIASGAYFVRLISPDGLAIRKILYSNN